MSPSPASADNSDAQAIVGAEQLALLRDIRWELQTIRKSQDVLRVRATSGLLDEVHEEVHRRQLGFFETLAAVRDESLSFARFGDGELQLMLRSEYKLGFQSNSPQLQAALRRVWEEPPPNLLIGFPHVFRDLHYARVWSDVWGQTKPLLQMVDRVGMAHVSRPLFFDVTRQRGVEAWRAIWDGLDITLVTGAHSRMELLPELFSGIRSQRLVRSQPRNAFEDLPRLMGLPDMNDRGQLYLIALGPAGTVLAAELARRGLRALDIGHISDSFQYVFKGGKWPESKPAVTTPSGSA